MPSCFKALLLILLVPCAASAQGNSKHMDRLAASVIKRLRAGSNESILLQTDKSLYVTGETVWAKAFLLDSINSRFSAKENLLFFDIVNEKDSVLQQLLIPVAALQTDAAFILKDNVASGNYFIRAYTEGMAKAASQAAVKAVYILNADDNTRATTSVKNNVSNGAAIPQVDIFPEGGSVISGTTTVVAFRLHDQNNQPLQGELMVKDLKNNKIVPVTTNAWGLGKCTLSPSWYSTYGVYLKKNDGYDSLGVLPKVNPYGMQLAVTEQNLSTVKVRVMMEDSVFQPEYPTYLMAIQQDSLYFASVGKGMYELNVPVAQLPAGVVHLLLFNEQDELASQRDVFIPVPPYVLAINADKDHYGAREKVTLNINLQDGTGKPLTAAMALSVQDIRFADTASLTYFKPAYPTGMAPADVDLALLATAPTIKDYLKAAAVSSPVTTNSSGEYFTIKGKVLDKKQNGLANEKVIIMSKSGGSYFAQDTTDANGVFETHLPEFADSTEFNIQLSGKKDQQDNYDIQYKQVKYPAFITPTDEKEAALKLNAPVMYAMQTQHLDSMLRAFGKITLPPVTVSTTENKSAKPKKEKSNSSNVLTREMLTKGGYNEIGQAVLSSGKFHLFGGFLINGAPNGFTSSATDEPIVVVDGVQANFPSSGDPAENSPVLAYLKTIPTNGVESVRMLTGSEGGIYGVRSGHGVIEITTSSKTEIPMAGGNVIRIYPKGYHVPPAFPMPDYANSAIKNSITPDLRTTLYWNGELATGQDGKATVSFFTADATATYLVTVTGVTTKGKRIYGTYLVRRN